MIWAIVGFMILFALCMYFCQDIHKPIPPPVDGIGMYFDGFHLRHTPPPIPPKRENFDSDKEFNQALVQHKEDTRIWTISFHRYSHNSNHRNRR